MPVAGIGYGFLGQALAPQPFGAAVGTQQNDPMQRVRQLAEATEPFVEPSRRRVVSGLTPSPTAFARLLGPEMGRAAAMEQQNMLGSVNPGRTPSDSRRASSLLGALMDEQRMAQQGQQFKDEQQMRQQSGLASVLQNFATAEENRRTAAAELGVPYEPLGAQQRNIYGQMAALFGGDPESLSFMQQGATQEPPAADFIRKLDDATGQQDLTQQVQSLKSQLDAIARRADKKREPFSVGFGAFGPKVSGAPRLGPFGPIPSGPAPPESVARQLAETVSSIEDPELRSQMAAYAEKLIRQSPSLSDFLGE